MRSVTPRAEWRARAKELQAPYELVAQVAETGQLPVPNFAAGGVATPADAALVMQMGAQAVFVGSGIFKSSEPERTAKAMFSKLARRNIMVGRGAWAKTPAMNLCTRLTELVR